MFPPVSFRDKIIEYFSHFGDFQWHRIAGKMWSESTITTQLYLCMYDVLVVNSHKNNYFNYYWKIFVINLFLPTGQRFDETLVLRCLTD